MQINGVELEDTFAEAFGMWGSRLIVTGDDAGWARTAAEAATGFATSIIGCGCEAGTNDLAPDEATPDGRPGVAALVFTTSRKSMEAVLLQRVGQAVMTCATSACYDGLAAEEKLKVGGKLRYFGDGFQRSKLLDGRRQLLPHGAEPVCGSRRRAGRGGGHALRAGGDHAVPRRRRPQRQQGILALQGTRRLEQHAVLPDAPRSGGHRAQGGRERGA
jgi:formylmethanofuran--tetrahydromethanopterin N-formyltransferase